MAKSRRQTAPRAAPASGTVGYWVEVLSGQQFRQTPTTNFLAWPPDSFGVAARLLREMGDYVQLLSDWPPAQFEGYQEYENWANQQGQEWFQLLAQRASENAQDPAFEVPQSVVELWLQVFKCRPHPLKDTADLWKALIQICALADQASRSIVTFGMFPEEGSVFDRVPWALREWMMENLMSPPSLKAANLCSENIDRNQLVVLPKMRTPLNGITMRSLSHHLALLPTSEVEVRWQPCQVDEHRLQDGINLLVFPWPLDIFPVQFARTTLEGHSPAGDYRYFEFIDESDSDVLTNRMMSALRTANQRFGKIDVIVFPEMALTVQAFTLIRQRLEEEDVVLLIGGVYERPLKGRLGRNYAKIHCFLDADEDAYYDDEQHKHHRWLLNESQVRTYGLGAQLNPRYGWWEGIEIPHRSLELLQLNPALMLSVLICEDLARPDPVGDAMRAVGPNLLIALLQDGPQLAGRWSERYATVLADDPGCSVLTLTGLGMTRLSRPANIDADSRVVALWKQADEPTRQIELPGGAEALVLFLSNEPRQQSTADGRFEMRWKGHVTLSGIHPITKQ